MVHSPLLYRKFPLFCLCIKNPPEELERFSTCEQALCIQHLSSFVPRAESTTAKTFNNPFTTPLRGSHRAKPYLNTCRLSHHLNKKVIMEVIVTPASPEWPEHFEQIKTQLAGDLADEGISYINIEHIGSTSIPDLPAKPIIDILITVQPLDFNDTTLERFKEALSWGTRQGGYHYIGSGGVQGRWSFKLYGYVEPARNVYVMAEDDGLVLRSYRALKEVLAVDSALREEYGRIKWGIAAEQEYGTIMQYAAKKRPIIRKILKAAGWTDEMVDEQEAMSVTDWPSDPERFY